VAQEGSFGQKTRHATTWTLTEFEIGGQAPPKDFMKWRAADQKQKPVSKSAPLGINGCVRPSLK
jgi:hypothetical protein